LKVHASGDQLTFSETILHKKHTLNLAIVKLINCNFTTGYLC